MILYVNEKYFKLISAVLMIAIKIIYVSNCSVTSSGAGKSLQYYIRKNRRRSVS